MILSRYIALLKWCAMPSIVGLLGGGQDVDQTSTTTTTTTVNTDTDNLVSERGGQSVSDLVIGEGADVRISSTGPAVIEHAVNAVNKATVQAGKTSRVGIRQSGLTGRAALETAENLSDDFLAASADLTDSTLGFAADAFFDVTAFADDALYNTTRFANDALSDTTFFAGDVLSRTTGLVDDVLFNSAAFAEDALFLAAESFDIATRNNVDLINAVRDNDLEQLGLFLADAEANQERTQDFALQSQQPDTETNKELFKMGMIALVLVVVAPFAISAVTRR